MDPPGGIEIDVPPAPVRTTPVVPPFIVTLTVSPTWWVEPAGAATGAGAGGGGGGGEGGVDVAHAAIANNAQPERNLTRLAIIGVPVTYS